MLGVPLLRCSINGTHYERERRKSGNKRENAEGSLYFNTTQGFIRDDMGSGITFVPKVRLALSRPAVNPSTSPQ